MNQQLQTAKDIILNLKNNKKSIAFDKLWKNVCTKLKIRDEQCEILEPDFYITLLEEPCFIKLTSNEWTLKELFSYDDVKKITAPAYNTEEFEINEDEYQNYMSNIELKELAKKKLHGNSSDGLDADGHISLLDAADDTKQLDDEDADENEIEGDEY